MSIRYVPGDATLPIGHGPKVLVHVCNDVGGWGRGFVLAVSKRWREPEVQYRRWFREQGLQPFALGQVQFVAVETDLWVANLVGQHDILAKAGTPPVRYEAIRSGLATVRDFACKHGAGVHMPRIGAGLAGGNWEQIAQMIDAELASRGLAVTVYDFPSLHLDTCARVRQ